MTIQPQHGLAVPRWTPVRAAVVLVAAGLVAPPFFLAAVAAGLSVTVSAAIAALVLVTLSLWSKRCVGPGLAIGRRQRLLFVIWVVLGLLTAYKLATLSVFMLDVQKQEYAFSPTIRPSSDPKLEEPFFPKHNCFTCYVVGAHLASQRVENVYDPDQYRDTEHPTPIHETIGDKLTIDRYQYPPPFLLLPKLLLLTGSDFFQIRTYWFALNILVFGVTTLSLILWIGRSEFSALWLVFPFVLAAPTTLGTLQIENAHFLIVMISVAAMLAFEKNRTVLGGLLLGFAIVSKLFPGLLLGYLIFRRRWRAVFSTGAAMIALCVITLLVFGPAPFEAFIRYQRPRLASGEAFSFAWEYIRPLVLNSSVMGVAYKLDKLDLLAGAEPGGIARMAMWAFSGLLLALTAAAGLRHGRGVAGETADHGSSARRLGLARVWLALLVLAQLRSPFLPWGYGNVTVLLMLALLAPVERGGWLRWILLGVAWLTFGVTVPLPLGPATVTFDLYYTLAAQFITLALCFLLVLRRPRTWNHPQPVPNMLTGDLGAASAG